MKVILLKDIAKVGQRFDVKEMANGHALHLIKTGIVEMATVKKLARVESMRKNASSVKEVAQESTTVAISKIKEEGVSITAKANEQGHLFEGITADKITEAITATVTELPNGIVMLEEPIKELGEYMIELLNGDKVTKVALVIVVEE